MPAKQLLFFYAWQHGEGMKQLPGIGPTDFVPWLAALARAGYAEYVNPFMHGHPGVGGNGQGTGHGPRLSDSMPPQGGGWQLSAR